MLKTLFKFSISAFANILKRNKNSIEYLLSVPLKDQVSEYYDNSYFKGYSHITNTIRIASKFLKPDQVILDIGGATGNTVKLFAEKFAQNPIYAFEPLPENIQKLKSVAGKYPNVSVISNAVGDCAGKTIVHKAARITSSSILPLNADPKSSAFSENLESAGDLEVEVVALDEFFKNPVSVGIMKIDVQGYELKVLTGAKKTLRLTDFIIIEVSNHEHYLGGAKYYEIDNFLRENNFIISDLYPSTKDNDFLKEWDSVYINKRVYENWHN
jgi:FkbM family methyltransferase